MNDKYCYETKSLFLEYKNKKCYGVRFYFLIYGKNRKDAVCKTSNILKKLDYPYNCKSKVEWNFLGIEDVVQCYQFPKDKALLTCMKDSGTTWEDAIPYIKPYSECEISTMGFSECGVNLVTLVYFVKNSSKDWKGKVTSCQFLFKANDREILLSKIYKFALTQSTLDNVKKIRLDCSKKSIVEFVGINEINPVFDNIGNGMEIYRTVEKFKTKKSILEYANKNCLK